MVSATLSLTEPQQGTILKNRCLTDFLTYSHIFTYSQMRCLRNIHFPACWHRIPWVRSPWPLRQGYSRSDVPVSSLLIRQNFTRDDNYQYIFCFPTNYYPIQIHRSQYYYRTIGTELPSSSTAVLPCLPPLASSVGFLPRILAESLFLESLPTELVIEWCK